MAIGVCAVAWLMDAPLGSALKLGALITLAGTGGGYIAPHELECVPFVNVQGG